MLKERAIEAIKKLGFTEGSHGYEMALMGYVMGWQDRAAYEIDQAIERQNESLKEATS